MNALSRLLSRFTFLRWLALLALLLGAASSALATKIYTNNGDGTVTDATTGLTWMRCAMGKTWTGTTCVGTTGNYTWFEANALTAAVTFASNGDWRLPTIRELQTIYVPDIDYVAFPSTPAPDFWSATVYAPNLNGAWYVFSSDNFAFGLASKLNAHQVRLVRGGQPLGLLDIARPTTDYVDHGNGTATHSPTGLMWKRCREGEIWLSSACSGTASSFSWDTASLLTGNSIFAEYNDWRMPTREELLTLVDYASSSPAINKTVFPTVWGGAFWSSSKYINGGVVNFTDGQATIMNVVATLPVLLVRTGQSLDTVGLTITKTGSGTVMSSPVGIICGSICNTAVSTGTVVTLTANAAVDNTFTGWGGACSGTGTCVVTMSAATTVSATFAVSVPTRFINISTRGQVQTGDNVMIVGFIIQGSASQTVLIRAVGPTLANYGVSGVLANPKLDLYSGQTVIAINDNWGTASNAAAIQATGLAPVSSLESAILITLAPGAYTAIVRGSDGGSGVGIVEVYAQ